MNAKPLILYFGSFNPVHEGHLAVGQAALRHFGDKAEVWFMLSAQNPFKSADELWPEEQRWVLLQAALEGKANMRACDMELHLPRPSYTVNTLAQIRKQVGAERPLYLLMGEDNLAKLHTWRDFETLIQGCRVMVYPRGDGHTGAATADATVFDKPNAEDEFAWTMLRRENVCKATGRVPTKAEAAGRDGAAERIPTLPDNLIPYANRFILLSGVLFPQSSTQIRLQTAAQATETHAAEADLNIGATPEAWAEVLQWRGEKTQALREAARKVKLQTVGSHIYLRGLIEYSNRCQKNCYYCGIRAENRAVNRYTVSEDEVLRAAEFAYQNGFGSIVLQSGERQDEDFIRSITHLLEKITKMSHGSLGITLSLGEQSLDTYRRWKEAGASRYLLRIETSNPALYAQLHPADHRHSVRLKALESLREANYMVGTGVMIGLPGQTPLDLANDLKFFRDHDIDMIGMGPYIEHHDTPLYARKDEVPSLEERYELSLNMLALLRLVMPTVNMAASTAMASLSPKGREEALRIAANVVMPNITPFAYRPNYFLYENKLCIKESLQDTKAAIEALAKAAGGEIRYFEKGDPKHYFERNAASTAADNANATTTAANADKITPTP